MTNETTYPEIPDNSIWLDDGFGNRWRKCAIPDCGLEIVRPGKVQCERDACLMLVVFGKKIQGESE